MRTLKTGANTLHTSSLASRGTSMKVRRLLAGVGGVVAVLAIAVPSFASKGAARPDPIVAEWPNWPYRVSCGVGMAFDPTKTFSGPVDAEQGSRPAERALRYLTTKGYMDWVPNEGWRLGRETRRSAIFLRGRPGAPMESGNELERFELERRRGHWDMSGYDSPCELLSVRRGSTAQPWFLASSQAKLAPGTRTVRVDVGPGYCDGKAAADAEKPVFREVEGKLVMTIWLRRKRVRGGACEPPKHEPALVVRLPRRLGHRELLDGGVYPPRVAQHLPRLTLNPD